MITDKLQNINEYSEIPLHAKEFIKQLTGNIECGRYTLSDTDYANVETYETKKHKDCLFECHREYADIQILLSGSERLDYADIEKLDLKTPYDENKDIMFFKNSAQISCSVMLDGTNFVFLFPNEAHRPQMCLEPQLVKKVVIKIKI